MGRAARPGARPVCTNGWNDDIGAFLRSTYGSTELDASLLMVLPVGFLTPTTRGPPPTSMRSAGSSAWTASCAATAPSPTTPISVDGLPPGEGAFLLTTFWWADNLAMLGRVDEAIEVFERLRSLRNDVGLLAEEYDPTSGRMLGNFPQAFSHVGLCQHRGQHRGRPGSPGDRRRPHPLHPVSGSEPVRGRPDP